MVTPAPCKCVYEREAKLKSLWKKGPYTYSHLISRKNMNIGPKFVLRLCSMSANMCAEPFFT